MAAMAAVIVFSSAAPSTAEPTAESTAVEQTPGKEGKWSWVCWVATLSRLGDWIYPSLPLQGCIR